MGWDSRRNGLVRPTPPRTIAFADVSKEQLAAALNEVSAQLKEYRRLLEEATRVLVAITLEPESFRFTDGRRTVDLTAFDKVKNGMLLRMTQGTNVLQLTVDGETAPPIDVPQILIPAGVR